MSAARSRSRGVFHHGWPLLVLAIPAILSGCGLAVTRKYVQFGRTTVDGVTIKALNYSDNDAWWPKGLSAVSPIGYLSFGTRFSLTLDCRDIEGTIARIEVLDFSVRSEDSSWVTVPRLRGERQVCVPSPYFQLSRLRTVEGFAVGDWNWCHPKGWKKPVIFHIRLLIIRRDGTKDEHTVNIRLHRIVFAEPFPTMLFGT